MSDVECSETQESRVPKTEGLECPECREATIEPKKKIVDNEVTVGGRYCASCGTDFDEGVKLSWDEIDFPVWIDWESYNDSWDMLRKFQYKTGLHDSAADGLTDMKYTVFSVWFRIDEDGSVNGPYDEKRGELIHE